jgi:hypothetical protein
VVLQNPDRPGLFPLIDGRLRTLRKADVSAGALRPVVAPRHGERVPPVRSSDLPRGAVVRATGRTRPTAATVAAVAALALLLVTVAATLHAGVPNEARWRLLGLIGASWLAFAVAATAVLHMPRRSAVPLVLIGAVALQVLAVSVTPRLTDDYFRYAWDGRVQAAGIDPYRYAPTDPALTSLRTEWLFPSGCTASSGIVCTRMNHPGSPTIYPPVAQAWFWVVHVLTRPLGPDGGGARTLQLAAALLALATTVALLLVLRRHGDPRNAVLWAWCPTVVLEAGNNAHADVLAAFLVVLAMGATVTGRPMRSGLAAGAAVAAKLVPVLVLPALLLAWWGRRHPRGTTVRWTTGVGAVLVAGYLPHLLAVGPRVLGFLPGYLAEEGFDGERRFALLRLLVPDRFASVAAAGVVVATATTLAVRARTHGGSPPWRFAVVLVGVAFTVLGISYPWYALLLVALVALDGRAEWLAVAAAAYPGYFTAALGLRFADTQRAGYGAAAAVVIAVSLWRRRRRHPEMVSNTAILEHGDQPEPGAGAERGRWNEGPTGTIP